MRSRMIGRRVGLGRAPLRHSVGLGYVVGSSCYTTKKIEEKFRFRHKTKRIVKIRY